MTLTHRQLAMALRMPQDKAADWLPHLQETFAVFGVTNVALFIAQTAHESANFSVLSENLNYSAQGLANIWSRYSVTGKRGGRPNQLALLLARKPKAIANNVYANRMGNGDVASGDGWKFKGRGLIQCTGRANYAECGRALGVDLLTNPDLLLTPRYAALSAGWYWRKHKLDALSVSASTRIINGGDLGLKHRQELFDAIIKVIGP